MKDRQKILPLSALQHVSVEIHWNPLNKNPLKQSLRFLWPNLQSDINKPCCSQYL